MKLLFILLRKSTKSICQLLAIVMLISISSFQCYAQIKAKPKGALRAGIYPSTPYGYMQLEATPLYYKQYSDAIDVIGQFAESFYSSTFSDAGYRSAMKVGDNWAIPIDSQNGTSSDGVTVTISIAEYNGLAQFKYTVINTNSTEKNISLGSRADVMIGNNDGAPITRKKYLDDSTYGLQMSYDHSEISASLVLLFGSDMEGIVPVDNYWFGHYGNNGSYDQIAGEYTETGRNLYEENGSYDSGLGWCWKNRELAPNSTSVFSVLIGVGDVTLLPMVQKISVSADDTTNWNDLTQSHRFNISGTYFSPASLRGITYYSIDNNEWIPLTDSLDSESLFEKTITATFTANIPVHTIRVSAKDQSGAYSPFYTTTYKTASSLAVNGISEQEYNGLPILLPDLKFSDPQNSATLTEGKHYECLYSNNINAGQAAIQLSGVYPYSIGTATHFFTIRPATLSGEIELSENSFVYTGTPITPKVVYKDNIHKNLTEGTDYTISFSSNIFPGEATVKIAGTGNYTGQLTKIFEITKKSIVADSLHFTLPSAETYYDGKPHPAIIELEEGMGVCTIYYTDSLGNRSTEIPIEPGKYSVSFEFEEGTCFKAASIENIAKFSILLINQQDWNILKQFYVAMGNGASWTNKWDITDDIKTAGNLYGVTLSQGRVTELHLPGNNLTGNLPFGIFALPYLTELDFSNNSLTGDLGKGMAAFMALNTNIRCNAVGINLGNNRLSGNVGLFASFFTGLKKLIVNKNQLSDVLPALSPEITELDLSGQTISKVVWLDWGNSNMEALIASLPTICLYDHSTQGFSSKISWLLSDKPDSPKWQVKIGYNENKFSIDQISEENAYMKVNGDTIYCTNQIGSGNGSVFRLKFTFASGDANFTGDVNVLDLQTIIKYIIDEYKSDPFNYTAANLQADNLINVQDIVRLVNILLDGETTTVAEYNNRTKSSVAEVPQASLSIEDGKLKLSTHKPVAAFDITLTGCREQDIQWQLNDPGFIFSTKSKGSFTHAIIYSLSGSVIPAGETVLAAISGGQPQLQSALLSDTDAKEIKVLFSNSGQPTDNSSITGDLEYRISREGIILTSGRLITNLQCKVYNTEGRLMTGTGLQPMLQGTTLFPWQTYLQEGCYIICIQTDDRIIKTMKTTIIK